MEQISIRPYLTSDAKATIDIFLQAIRQVAARDYSPAQIAAWARVDDAEAWAVKRSSRPAWIAEIASKPVGFTDLMTDGYLDMMFVHPDYQGLGVASLLLRQAEAEARRSGLHRIYTEASITAKPFFERRGFRLLQAQEVEKRGETLSNFLMEKSLDSPA